MSISISKLNRYLENNLIICHTCKVNLIITYESIKFHNLNCKKLINTLCNYKSLDYLV